MNWVGDVNQLISNSLVGVCRTHSVPSNIAEGAGRNSSKELFHFLGIANGSLAEVETQLELAARLKFVDTCAECRKQVALVGKLLVGLRNSIKKLDD